MSILRWDPFRELEDMNDRLNRVFGRPAATSGAGREALTKADWLPSVDISETDADYTIHAHLPGLGKDDVKVTVENGLLTMSGERKQRTEEKNRRFHRVETSYGKFVRSFALPDDADDSKVAAEFKDGVLNVRVPKTEKAKPKTVEVKVS